MRSAIRIGRPGIREGQVVREDLGLSGADLERLVRLEAAILSLCGRAAMSGFEVKTVRIGSRDVSGFEYLETSVLHGKNKDARVKEIVAVGTDVSGLERWLLGRKLAFFWRRIVGWVKPPSFSSLEELDLWLESVGGAALRGSPE